MSPRASSLACAKTVGSVVKCVNPTAPRSTTPPTERSRIQSGSASTFAKDAPDVSEPRFASDSSRRARAFVASLTSLAKRLEPARPHDSAPNAANATGAASSLNARSNVSEESRGGAFSSSSLDVDVENSRLARLARASRIASAYVLAMASIATRPLIAAFAPNAASWNNAVASRRAETNR